MNSKLRNEFVIISGYSFTGYSNQGKAFWDSN